jgi:hypothetical protein
LTQMAARGALLGRADHPEWRQFLMLAATRRANELNLLRKLPGMPARTGDEVARLPTGRSSAESDEATGSIPEGSSLPLDIGEPSSTELPVTTQEEKPPVIRLPERGKLQNESRNTRVPRVRRGRSAASRPAGAESNTFAAPATDANLALTSTTTP